MKAKASIHRIGAVAAVVGIGLIAMGALNGTAGATSQGKEVVITDPTTPTRQAGVDASGALQVSQQGTANVNVTNGALPVEVKETIDLAAADPVTERASSTFGNDDEVISFDVYTVPDGKNLVVEHASALALLGAGSIYNVELARASFDTLHNLIVTPQGEDSLGRDTFVTSQDVRLVLNAGEILSVTFRRNAHGAGGFAEAAISGYLVDASP